jgi:hypothetical protein
VRLSFLESDVCVSVGVGGRTGHRETGGLSASLLVSNQQIHKSDYRL